MNSQNAAILYMIAIVKLYLNEKEKEKKIKKEVKLKIALRFLL
jgi:hypothetical protein